MLVLSRMEGEKVLIQVGGKTICEIEVVGFRKDKVRIGFTAPAEVKVYRQEVAEAITAQRGAAS